MWWIIGIAIVFVIVYKINKEHNEHVHTHVSRYGSMTEKYKLLVEYLHNGGIPTQKVTKDSIILASNSMTWSLDYVGDNLEIRMKGYMPLYGNISHKWIFPDGYPQAKMIEEIESYMDWQFEQIKNIAEHSPYKHINEE